MTAAEQRPQRVRVRAGTSGRARPDVRTLRYRPPWLDVCVRLHKSGKGPLSISVVLLRDHKIRTTAADVRRALEDAGCLPLCVGAVEGEDLDPDVI